MKYILSIFFYLHFTYSFGQKKLELSDLFLKTSKEVVNTKEIGANKNIIVFSENKQNSIKFLIEEFTNTKSTKVYSDCLKRNINLGELAIIIVDKIEPMPYLKLTAIKNAEEKSKQYCKSGNVIEFYLNQISMEGSGIKDFQYFYKRLYFKTQDK